MKETERRGPDNKERKAPARADKRDHKLQEKSSGRNLKAKESDAKPSSCKPETNTVVTYSNACSKPSDEDMAVDYVDDRGRSEEASDGTNTLKIDVNYSNKNLDDNSSDMEIADESDPETVNDSVSSQGDSQTADDEKSEKTTKVPKEIVNKKSSDVNSHAPCSKSESKANNLRTKASHEKTKRAAEPEKGPSGLAPKNSSDYLRNMKVHPKPLSDSSEGASDEQPEQGVGVGVQHELSNGARCVCSDDEEIDTEENDEHGAALDKKIEEMETRIKNLESELREVAALEIALYTVVAEHGGSTHKVHTPARRLSRLYIHACKYWSQDRRDTVARNSVAGLILVAKSCGNNVSRLTFWFSNTIVLREIISQAFGSSCHSRAKVPESDAGGEKSERKSLPIRWKSGNSSRELKKQTLQFVDDWQETRTFSAALEKAESWIFSRIVESIWWQTLTPNMQSPVGDSTTRKGSGRFLGPTLGDQHQGSFSINLWKNAFHDSLKRLCPVRAGGHECGCLPVMAKKVMEQCIGRLDVAIFNAILRESAHEIPTDPISDPIVDSMVLPIPAGNLSFGSGAQLKNSVGHWARWLSEFAGMDADNSAEDENKSHDSEGKCEEPKTFPLLNALSDLLMLPKDMLMEQAVRMEVCPSISLPLVKRILCNFTTDEFWPDPVPGAVLEALNAECFIERRLSGDSSNSFPYAAAPVVYMPPCSSDVAEKITEANTSSQLSPNASAVPRKGYTSDEGLDEIESCLISVIDNLPLSLNVSEQGHREVGYDGANARYDLLREVWQAT